MAMHSYQIMVLLPLYQLVSTQEVGVAQDFKYKRP